ncbi:MAG: alpha-L-fucosidase [Terracidiphilus sp.]
MAPSAKPMRAARRRFVDYTHGLIRELLTNYGKIDILWYDVAWPLTAEQWESERMNEMVFSLQPDIIVNNRNLLPGDFTTPEQHIQAAETGRAWETCMTLNDSWGFNRGDDAWKTPKTIVDNLITCGRGGGNYLLNIGPEPDGSVPPSRWRFWRPWASGSTRIGKAIYGGERMDAEWYTNLNFTRRGNTLYVHVNFWPGHTPAAEWLDFYKPEVVVAFAGLKPRGALGALAQDWAESRLHAG